MAIIIDGQFNGPPESGNGGYVAGLVADLISEGPDTFEIALKAPPPMDTPLTAQTGENGALQLMDGETLLVEGRLKDDWSLDLPEFAPPGPERATRGSNELGFDNCFVCGSNRTQGDGLCLFSAKKEDPSNQWSAPLIVDPAFCDEKGFFRRRFVVCALDCPGYAAVGEGELAVLARFVFSVTGTLKAGDEARVHAWPISVSGRKRIAGTAIIAPSGDVIARAEALWITIKPEQLRKAS